MSDEYCSPLAKRPKISTVKNLSKSWIIWKCRIKTRAYINFTSIIKGVYEEFISEEIYQKKYINVYILTVWSISQSIWNAPSFFGLWIASLALHPLKLVFNKNRLRVSICLVSLIMESLNRSLSEDLIVSTCIDIQIVEMHHALELALRYCDLLWGGAYWL